MSNFISILSEKSGMTEDQCKEFLQHFADSAKKALFDGEDVAIRNFGKFIMVKKTPRTHKGLGKVVEVGPKRKIRFYPSNKMLETSDIKTLINLLNESKKGV